MKKSLYDHCVEHDRENLLSEWHPTLNRPLTPKAVSYGSKKKVWWICEKSHEWQATVTSRTGCHSGCPSCAGKRLTPGENDLATTHPELAQEWHPIKNHILKPDNVVAGTHQKVWWLCKYGHEWQAEVNSRTSGTGCPVCSGREAIPGETDLASVCPEVARDWHPTKNGALRPDKVTAYSNKKVWWVCENGHEWQTAINNRTQKGRKHTYCPYCTGRKVLEGFNDLATQNPDLAAQWHPTKNKELTPNQVTSGSNKKVWWICEKGHEWQAVVWTRKTGAGCRICVGKGRPPQKNLNNDSR